MNRVSITMEGLSENISFARVAATAFITPLDPSVEEVTEIKTAVSEAVTNAIIHGYPAEGTGRVHMTISAQDKTVTIEVADDGIGIADIDTARRPLFTTKEELERSGLGFTVMESFMDSVTVESTPGEGTKVTLTKTLASRE